MSSTFFLFILLVGNQPLGPNQQLDPIVNKISFPLIKTSILKIYSNFFLIHSLGYYFIIIYNIIMRFEMEIWCS